jgi:hypothetical protein
MNVDVFVTAMNLWTVMKMAIQVSPIFKVFSRVYILADFTFNIQFTGKYVQ